jgi:hypothetical protein
MLQIHIWKAHLGNFDPPTTAIPMADNLADDTTHALKTQRTESNDQPGRNEHQDIHNASNPRQTIRL